MYIMILFYFLVWYKVQFTFFLYLYSLQVFASGIFINEVSPSCCVTFECNWGFIVPCFVLCNHGNPGTVREYMAYFCRQCLLIGITWCQNMGTCHYRGLMNQAACPHILLGSFVSTLCHIIALWCVRFLLFFNYCLEWHCIWTSCLFIKSLTNMLCLEWSLLYKLSLWRAETYMR